MKLHNLTPTTLAMAVVVSVIALSNPAHATVLASETGDVVTGVRSDIDLFTIIYDRFSLAADSTITDVEWRGLYASVGTPQAEDAFTIRVFADNGGPADSAALGGLIGEFVVGNAVNRTNIPLTAFSPEHYSYAANLVGGSNLNAGSYWLSIFNNTLVDPDDNWFWAISNESGNDALLEGLPAGGGIVGINTNPLYALLGNTDVAVPEPSTFAILGLGLAGLGFARRRKQAA